MDFESEEPAPYINGSCPGVPMDEVPIGPGHHLEHARPPGYPRVLSGRGEVRRCWEENMGCHSCCGGSAYGCPVLKKREWDSVVPMLGMSKVRGGANNIKWKTRYSMVEKFWKRVAKEEGWKNFHGKTQTTLVWSNPVGRRRQPHLVFNVPMWATCLKGWGGYTSWLPDWQSEMPCTSWEERPVVVLPASWLLKGFSHGKWANIGHWMAEVFAPVLQALRLIGESYGLLLLLRRTSSNLLPWDAAWESAWAYRTADLGLPWMDHLAPPAPLTNGTCIRKILIACPHRACPSAKYVHQRMPEVRAWLAARYGMSFAPRPVPPRPRVIICTRRPGGSRYIDNAAELAAAAEAEGWVADTMPHFAGVPMGRWLPAVQGADFFAAFHGADLILPLTLMRRGAAVVEIIPLKSAARDPWYTFMAVGSGIHLLRWVVPTATLRFDVEASIAADMAEWNKTGHKDGGNFAHNVRADNVTAVYDGLQWRRLFSNATLAVPQWREVLRNARAALRSVRQ